MDDLKPLLPVSVSIYCPVSGDFNSIGVKTVLEGCTIGNSCFIAAALHLVGVTIPDNTSVYNYKGQWRCGRVDIGAIFPVTEAYLDATTSEASPQYIGKHHKLRE
jgi:hypothetical protein